MKKKSSWLSIILFIALVVFGLLIWFLLNDVGALKDRIVELDQENRQLEQTKTSLQTDIDQLHAEIDRLQNEIDLAHEEIENMFIAPRVRFSTESALQGDIVSVSVEMNSAKGEPLIETKLGDAHFIPLTDGTFVSYVPVNYDEKAGDYEIRVSIEDIDYVGKLHVSEREYAEQHMTMSSSTASSTIGAAGAGTDWNEKIVSLFDTWDDTRYWTLPFIRPIEGRISTQFGLYRYTTYTEGGSRTSRHTGIDIAVPEGTPVPASNDGRVVFAGEVIYTGNTVVIEHGGGLKTYYYHMSKIDCKAGDMVAQGDIIGEVGMTGYATGPHLHFEVRIGKCSLSPWEMFDGSSGLYKFD